MIFIYPGISVFVCSLTHALGCYVAAKRIHETLLHKCHRWPMHYFDTTPIGRILNVFSADINVVDIFLPMLLAQFIRMTCTVITRPPY